MGWCSAHSGEHEGYLVGFVVRDGCRDDDPLLRELEYPRDNCDRTDVRAIAAACECGWRSPRWRARVVEWSPYCVWASEADEERGRQLWSEHDEHEWRLQTAKEPTR